MPIKIVGYMKVANFINTAALCFFAAAIFLFLFDLSHSIYPSTKLEPTNPAREVASISLSNETSQVNSEITPAKSDSSKPTSKTK